MAPAGQDNPPPPPSDICPKIWISKKLARAVQESFPSHMFLGNPRISATETKRRRRSSSSFTGEDASGSLEKYPVAHSGLGFAQQRREKKHGTSSLKTAVFHSLNDPLSTRSNFPLELYSVRQRNCSPFEIENVTQRIGE